MSSSPEMKRAYKQIRVSTGGSTSTAFWRSSHDFLHEGWGYAIDFRKLVGMNALHIT
jgi:hypothetical protein